MERERSFETGMDEQAKQAAMSNLTEKVEGHDRRNDRSGDYYETLRLERLTHSVKKESLEIKEREMQNSERQELFHSRIKSDSDRDLVKHMANLRHLNHVGKAYEELIEKDAEEAKAISEILSGPHLDSIKTILVKALSEVVAKIQK